jgi:hypothetical protein
MALQMQNGTFQWPTSPGGGGGGYSNWGGGGGGGGGGSSKPDYSSWAAWAAAARPQQGAWTNLDMPDRKPWDSAQFDTARQGITTGLADAQRQGNTAFNLAAQRYLNYQNPYASGPRQRNPRTDQRLVDSMNAWGGAGSNAAAQVAGEGVQADSAMGSVYDLLGNVGRQYNNDQLAAIQGDRMQLNQRLGGEGRMLGLGVDMASARSRSAYDDQVYNNLLQQAMYNNQGLNSMNQSNTQQNNGWNSAMMQAILDMIGSGGTGIPTDPNAVMVA